MSLISPTFKTTNTLSNLGFNTIKSSMQIGFIWQLLGKRGYAWHFTNTPLLKKDWNDWTILSYNIPKELLGNAISPKIFDDRLLHCGSTKKVGKN